MFVSTVDIVNFVLADNSENNDVEGTNDNSDINELNENNVFCPAS
jgi:hypothetical protein